MNEAKQIELEVISTEDIEYTTTFKIAKQTHRNSAFGECGADYYDHDNGITLISSGSPEWRAEPGNFWVQGVDKECDEVSITVDTNVYGKIQEAVHGYNRFFSNTEPNMVTDCETEYVVNAYMTCPSGYLGLFNELKEALVQASAGKGKERHANNLPFDAQPIAQITRSVGTGFPLGQAVKKIEESITIGELKGTEAQIHELHGAINYLAAACMILREGKEADDEY